MIIQTEYTESYGMIGEMCPNTLLDAKSTDVKKKECSQHVYKSWETHPNLIFCTFLS